MNRSAFAIALLVFVLFAAVAAAEPSVTPRIVAPVIMRNGASFDSPLPTPSPTCCDPFATPTPTRTATPEDTPTPSATGFNTPLECGDPVATLFPEVGTCTPTPTATSEVAE